MKQNKSGKAIKPPSPLTTSSKNFDLITTDTFMSSAWELKKKYPHIKEDFKRLKKELKDNAFCGKHVKNDIYKIRLRITDKNSGERDGGRVIVEVKVIEQRIYLLYVYDKSVVSNPEEKFIDFLVKKKPILSK